jgi:hypothetical protein
VLTFQVGAVLRMAASGLGVLNLSGAGSAIQGWPVVRFDAASAVAYVAVKLLGVATTLERIRYEVNANVTNCKLLRFGGDYSTSGPITLAGIAEFFGACEMMRDDGTPVQFATPGPVIWQMTDDGVTTRNYAWVIRYHCTDCEVAGLAISHGGRQLINAIIDVDGPHNGIRNVQIQSSAGALNGILMRDAAGEFFYVYSGEMVGNYLAGSVGVRCGTPGGGNVPTPAVGQLKAYDLKIRNWEKGCLITGSCDAPLFDGCTIANNKLAHIEVDSQRGASVWPVSGLTWVGGYSEEVAFPGCPFLHLVSGDFAGAIIGGEIGYTGTAVLVEATMGINTLEVDGARLPAAAPGDAFATPNTFSNFYRGRCWTSGSNLFTRGAFAARGWTIDDPVFNTVKVNTSFQLGTAGDPYFAENFTFVTANFAAGVPADDQVSLSFGFAAQTLTRQLSWALTGPLAAQTALDFFCFCDSNGSVTLRARNNTLVATPAAAGTLFLRSTKIL